MARSNPTPDPLRSAQGRLGGLIRLNGDPILIAQAQRELTEAKLQRQIDRALESAPPLTAEQRTRLAARLAPYAGGAR